MNFLVNPLGRRLVDVDLVRVGKGQMVHVKHPDAPGTLCMPDGGDTTAGGTVRRKRPSSMFRVQGAVATCYRCLKLMAVNQSLRGDPLDVVGRKQIEPLLEEAYAAYGTRNRGPRG
jgi:hypothetical protein